MQNTEAWRREGVGEEAVDERIGGERRSGDTYNSIVRSVFSLSSFLPSSSLRLRTFRVFGPLGASGFGHFRARIAIDTSWRKRLPFAIIKTREKSNAGVGMD